MIERKKDWWKSSYKHIRTYYITEGGLVFRQTNIETFYLYNTRITGNTFLVEGIRTQGEDITLSDTDVKSRREETYRSPYPWILWFRLYD